MVKYGIFQYYKHFIAQVLICEVLQTCFGLTGHTDTSSESRSHTTYRINPGAVASSSEDVRHVVHCLSCYYAPFHLLYQLKNGLQVSQIKEVNVVVRSLRIKDNRNGYRSSSLNMGKCH